MISNCCFAQLKTEFREELYHGCDDDYELIIPFLVCSKCRKVQLIVDDTEDSKRLHATG